MKKKILLLLFFLLQFASGLYSEIIIDTVKSSADDRFKFGLLGDYILDYNFSDFRQLPGVEYFAPKFTEADGTGYRLGLLFETPLLKKPHISYVGRLIFSDEKSIFSKNNLSVELIDGKETVADIIYSIDTKLQKISYENFISLRTIKNLNLLIGFNLGFFTNSNFSQKEKLEKPETGFFSNNSRERHQVSGEIQNLSAFQSSMCIGANYDFKFGYKEVFILSPEIIYSYSFTPVTTSINWKYNSLNLGISFKYSPAPPDRIFESKEEIHYDTLQITTDKFAENTFVIGKENVKIDTSYKKNYTSYNTIKSRTDTLFIPEIFDYPELIISSDSNFTHTDLKSITYKENLRYNQKPLLAFVFFDEMSESIPARYKSLNESEVKNFNIKEMFNSNTLESYQNILNIIGYRLRQFPSAKITLTGSISNVDNEMKKPDLAQKRAESIANYLSNIWKIEKSRITLKSRISPVNPSNMTDEDGKAENRRVEIISDNPEITKFLGIIDTVRKVTPDRIFVKLKNTNPKSTYSINLIAKNTEKYSFENDIPIEIDLNKFNVKYLETVNISADALLNGKKNYQTKNIKLAINKSLSNVISESSKPLFEVYNLFLFAFNSYQLKDEHRQILDGLKKRKSEFKSIKITGYSDRIGNDEFNKNLSLKRAQEVADYLNLPNTTVEGVGESKLLYDNSNPEGRFYSRTVIIEIEKYK